MTNEIGTGTRRTGERGGARGVGGCLAIAQVGFPLDTTRIWQQRAIRNEQRGGKATLRITRTGSAGSPRMLGGSSNRGGSRASALARNVLGHQRSRRSGTTGALRRRMTFGPTPSAAPNGSRETSSARGHRPNARRWTTTRDGHLRVLSLMFAPAPTTTSPTGCVMRMSFRCAVSTGAELTLAWIEERTLCENSWSCRAAGRP